MYTRLKWVRNHLHNEGGRTTSEFSLMTVFGIDPVRFDSDDAYNEEVTNAIDAAIDEWCNKHPALSLLYYWDVVMGVGSMLRRGLWTSLFVLASLETDSQTVIALQSFYIGTSSSFDGRPTSLMNEYQTLMRENKCLRPMYEFSHCLLYDTDVGVESLDESKPYYRFHSHSIIDLLRRRTSYMHEVDTCLKNEDTQFDLLDSVAACGHYQLFDLHITHYEENGDISIEQIYQAHQWKGKNALINSLVEFRRLRCIRRVVTSILWPAGKSTFLFKLIRRAVEKEDDDLAYEITNIAYETTVLDLKSLISFCQWPVPRTSSFIVKHLQA